MQVDGLTSHGRSRSPGSTDNFLQTNANLVPQNSGPSLEPADGPPVVEASGQVGSDLSVPMELQGLSPQEAIDVLSAQVVSLRTELARRGRDNIRPGTSTPIHPGVQRDGEAPEPEPTTPNFGQVPEELSTESHVFYEYPFPGAYVVLQY